MAPIGGAALPMGFNRIPHYRTACCWSATPADGEPVQRRGHRLRDGVGRARRAVRDAGARPAEGAAAEAALESYPTALKAGARRLLPDGQHVLQADRQADDHGPATRLGLPRSTLMYLVLKLLAGLYDPRDGATSDRVITAMARLAPSV